MSDENGGTILPRTGQRPSRPAVTNFYASDVAFAIVPPAPAASIPSLVFTPPAGTYLVTLSIHADALGVTTPGIAISVAGVGIIADSPRPMAASARSRSMTQTRIGVDGTQAIEAVSTGSAFPTTFLERSLSAIRVQ